MGNLKQFLVLIVIIILIVIVATWVWRPSGPAQTSLAPRSQVAAVSSTSLLTSVNFAVLASTYGNSAATTITGDLGYTTGPGVAPTLIGTEHVADGAYNQAGLDQATALSALNAETCDFTYGSATNLSLLTQPLAAGVYCITGATSVGTGGITLSSAGTYLFKITGALDTVANSIVTISGSASACNVFWAPSAATTLGANSTFAGTVIDAAGITIGSTVNWTGRALAFGGTVTSNADTIAIPTSCSAPALPTLNVIKLVTNTGPGTAVAADFTIHVKQAGSEVGGSPGSPLPGVAAPGRPYLLAAGTYVVSEDSNTAYVQTFTGDCDATGSVTMASADKICTVVNTDIPAPAAVTSGGGGGGTYYPPIVPLIGISKLPTPLALPAGAGPVTYGYTVWNVGKQQPLVDVTVTDDKCGPVARLSGDVNLNNKLEPTEIWKYSCTTTLAQTTTNTAVATGYSNDTYHQPAIATAVATVVVGSVVPPPLINIVKVPSRLTPLPFGGGPVSYTYTVTNPGIVALNSVVVTDDKCGPVTRLAGDSNTNNLLEPGEVWTYTCSSNIVTSTRNVAMAAGKANGSTALGYAFATVLVSVPGLPNTGFPPRGELAPLDAENSL